jgi:hypothetical protein
MAAGTAGCTGNLYASYGKEYKSDEPLLSRGFAFSERILRGNT